MLVCVVCTNQALGQAPQVACGVAAYDHNTTTLAAVAHEGDVLDYVVQVANGPYPIDNGVVTLTLPDLTVVPLDSNLSLPAGGSAQYPVAFPPVPANQQYTIDSNDIGNNPLYAPANSVQALSSCVADANIGGGATVEVTGTGQWPTLVVTPLYVDNDAPNDPEPNNPDVSDPLEDGSAEHPFDAIQEAIDAAVDGDTVVIIMGTFTGTGNRDIDFSGKAITVRSTNPSDSNTVETTVIDCESKGHGFVFYTGETANTKVSGFTITKGYALLGGGVYCSNNSSPSISNCVISGNTAVFGGAVACSNSGSSPEITNCIITDNSAIVGGGGIYCNGSSSKTANCIISGNLSPDGGAIYSHNPGNPAVVNCTISENAASGSAGGIYCYKSSNMTINNSIVWGNTAQYASEILVGNVGDETTMQISYSDIKSPNENAAAESGCTIVWGQGNIDIDPCFVKAGEIGEDKSFIIGDYHLLKGSGCIDAGDPAFAAGADETDIDGNPRVSGAKVDIGADEFVVPIVAIVRVMPKTLNLTSKGNWATCTIELPDDYDIGDINTASIVLSSSVLSGEISPEWVKTDEEARKLLVKFSRFEIRQEMLNDAFGIATLTVDGELQNGELFSGEDSIRIVHKDGKK